MRYSLESFLGSNITIVFSNLALDKISRDRIRGLFPQTELIDAEGLLLVIARPGILVQIMDQRIVVIDQTQSQPGETDLWNKALKISEVAGSQVTAYGFNYDIGVKIEDVPNAIKRLTEICSPNAPQLEKILGVAGLAIAPRLLYSKNSAAYDLRFDPVQTGPERMVVHLNVHFGDKPLPDSDLLRRSFVSEFSEAKRVLDLL